MNLEYGKSFFGKDLKIWAKSYLEKLPEDVTHLLTMGSSGCAIASGMIALSPDRELYQIYVKKEGERSHCSHTTYPCSTSIGGDIVGAVAIVDDFISTGETVNELLDFARRNGIIVSYIVVHSYLVDDVFDKTNFSKIIIVEGESDELQKHSNRGSSSAVS